MNKSVALAFLTIFCAVGMMALLAVIVTKHVDSATDGRMDEQTFTNTKVYPDAYKGWQGEVVKCEKMTEGLYKALVKRTASGNRNRMDTLLTTSALNAGDKVDYQKVVAYNNDMPVNIKIAVPVTK